LGHSRRAAVAVKRLSMYLTFSSLYVHWDTDTVLVDSVSYPTADVQ